MRVKTTIYLKSLWISVQEKTCFIMIVDDGNAERFPFAPAAKSRAASPQALPTQSVKMGGFTYLKQKQINLRV